LAPALAPVAAGLVLAALIVLAPCFEILRSQDKAGDEAVRGFRRSKSAY